MQFVKYITEKPPNFFGFLCCFRLSSFQFFGLAFCQKRYRNEMRAHSVVQKPI
jgi:hypothetical protein